MRRSPHWRWSRRRAEVMTTTATPPRDERRRVRRSTTAAGATSGSAAATTESDDETGTEPCVRAPVRARWIDHRQRMELPAPEGHRPGQGRAALRRGARPRGDHRGRLRACVPRPRPGRLGHRLRTTFGYMDHMTASAPDFPDTKFEHASGSSWTRTWPRTGVTTTTAPISRVMAAGAATESGTIGYVGAFAIPDVLSDLNAFTLGAREVNPRCDGADGVGQLVVRPADRGPGGGGADRSRRRRAQDEHELTGCRHHCRPERPAVGRASQRGPSG